MAEVELEKDRKRSPNYPSISLLTAVEKIKILYKEDRGAATAPEIMAKHWATTVKSSSFLQTVGALRKYGLIIDIEGPVRKHKLTKTAMEIVMLPESDSKYTMALKRAALKPKLFNDLWMQYGSDLPSEETLAHELVSAHGFLVDAATDAIKQYKRNIEFVKLGKDDNISDSGFSKPPEIGDFIQWRSQGVDQFKEPQKVVGKSEDGDFLFVYGAPCGIPIEQAIRMDVPDPKLGQAMQEVKDFLSGNEVRKAPPNPFLGAARSASGVKQYTYTVDNGDAVLRWPDNLSPEDYEGIETWLESMKAKIKRSVAGSGRGDAPGAGNADGSGQG